MKWHIWNLAHCLLSVTSGLPKRGWLPFCAWQTQITHNSLCSAFNRPRNSIELATVCSCSHARIHFYHNGNFLVLVGMINRILCYKFLLWNFLALSGIVRVAEALTALAFLLKHLLWMEFGERVFEKRNTEFIATSKTVWRQFLT